MDYPKLVAKFTLDAIDELMRYAKAVPSDKLTWRPVSQRLAFERFRAADHFGNLFGDGGLTQAVHG